MFKIHILRNPRLENTEMFGVRNWDICYFNESRYMEFQYSFFLHCFNTPNIWINKIQGALAMGMNSYSFPCAHIKKELKMTHQWERNLKIKESFMVESQGSLDNIMEFSVSSLLLYILITYRHYFPNAAVFSHIY